MDEKKLIEIIEQQKLLIETFIKTVNMKNESNAENNVISTETLSDTLANAITEFSFDPDNGFFFLCVV